MTPPFARACHHVFGHPRIAEVLPEYFGSVHRIIRSTVPLMEAAITRAWAMGPTDAVAAGVATYLEKHVEEERDHDEWLLDDLEVIGVDRATVLQAVPSPTEASLAGAQYYWVLHYHPVALLGYFAFAEGFPPSAELIQDLIARSGYPPEAFRTFAEHGELDPGHRQELDVAIDSLPLTAAQETALGLSAMTTGALLTKALEEVVEGFDPAEDL
jgi:hypothetical protein